MKPLTLFFIALFLLHITLGPYFVYYLLRGQPPKWSSRSFAEVAQKSVWVTYVGLISLALLSEYPNEETFVVAITISLYATVGYHFKYNEVGHYNIAMFDHIVYLIVPAIILYCYHNLDIFTYYPSYLTLFALVYLVIFTIYQHKLYSEKPNWHFYGKPPIF